MALESALNMIESLPVLQLGTDPILIVAIVIAAAIMVGLYLWWIGWAVFKRPLTGPEALVGKRGIVYSDVTLAEGGEVLVEGVIWKARLIGGGTDTKILKGDPVVVTSVSSLTLFVRRPTENK